MILAILIYWPPRCCLSCFKTTAFLFQEKNRKKKTFKMGVIKDFPSEQFLIFFIYTSPRCFLSSFMSVGLSVQRKRLKTDFRHGGHDKPSRTSNLKNFRHFDVRVTLILPTKFQVSWPFGANYRYSRWRPLRPSWISDRNGFSYF